MPWWSGPADIAAHIFVVLLLHVQRHHCLHVRVLGSGRRGRQAGRPRAVCRAQAEGGELLVDQLQRKWIQLQRVVIMCCEGISDLRYVIGQFLLGWLGIQLMVHHRRVSGDALGLSLLWVHLCVGQSFSCFQCPICGLIGLMSTLPSL